MSSPDRRQLDEDRRERVRQRVLNVLRVARDAPEWESACVELDGVFEPGWRGEAGLV